MMLRIAIPVVILVLFGFGAAALLATAPELEPDTPEPIATTVRVKNVKPETITLRVHSQGSVMPSTESQLIPEVSGRVVWMSPKLVAGGFFNKGDALVRVEPQDYNNSRERARAALVRAEAEHELAAFEYRRLQSLAERKLTSRSQLENALRTLRVAEASLSDAKASFSQAQQDVGRTELRAPFTGLVRSETVDIGQFVSRGQAIASIYASDQVEIRLPISDRQLAYLDIPIGLRGELQAEKQPRVTLSTEYAGQHISWEGRIVRAEAAIDTSSRMVYLVARVNADDQPVPLSVGLFVNADIEGRKADNVVVMPRTALRDNNQVLVVGRDERLRYRDIKLLRLYQNDLLIEGGLNEGERVCVSPIQTAIDGMTVKPIQDSSRGDTKLAANVNRVTAMHTAIAWFVRNPVAANLMMVFLVVCGLLGALLVNQEEFPSIDVRAVSISVPYLGAAPEEVEKAVCVRVEEAIEGLEGIEKVRSSATEGVCSVFAELFMDADDTVALNEIKSRVDGINSFPVETERPIVSKVTLARRVMQIALFGNANERTLKELARGMRDDIAAIESISQVSVGYTRPYEISIEVSENSLRQYGITLDQVARSIRTASLDMPGGTIRTARRRDPDSHGGPGLSRRRIRRRCCAHEQRWHARHPCATSPPFATASRKANWSHATTTTPQW